jgi:hypothetical protein
MIMTEQRAYSLLITDGKSPKGTAARKYTHD